MHDVWIGKRGLLLRSLRGPAWTSHAVCEKRPACFAGFARRRAAIMICIMGCVCGWASAATPDPLATGPSKAVDVGAADKPAYSVGAFALGKGFAPSVPTEPTDVTTLRELALLVQSASSKDARECLRHCDSVRKLCRRNPRLWIVLGDENRRTLCNIYLASARRMMNGKGDYAPKPDPETCNEEYNREIMRLLHAAVECDPLCKSAYEDRATAYSMFECPARAIDDFNTLEKLGVCTSRLFWQRGWLHYQLLMLSEARKDFNSALAQSDCEEISAHQLLAEVLLLLGQPKDALATHDRSAAGPHDLWRLRAKYIRSEMLAILGRAEESKQERSAAEAFLRNAGKGDSPVDDALRFVSSVLDPSTNRKDEAGLSQNTPETLAGAYFAVGMFDRCLREYTKCDLAKAKEPGRIHRERATVFLFRGELEKAVQSFSAEIEAEPEAPQGYFGRSHAWTRLGEADKAKADYEKGSRLASNSVPAFDECIEFFLMRVMNEASEREASQR